MECNLASCTDGCLLQRTRDHKRCGSKLIILESAGKHGISEIDMLAVEYYPYVVIEMRSEPEKLLFLGFD